MANKNKEILEFLEKCPAVKSFLYFNSATDKAGRVSIETVYSDVWEKRFIRDARIKAQAMSTQSRRRAFRTLWTGSMSRTDRETSLNSRDVRC